MFIFLTKYLVKNNMKTIIHYGLILLIISGLAAAVLAYVNEITRPNIEKVQKKKLIEGQKIAFPTADTFSDELKFNVDGKDYIYFEVYDSEKNVIGYELKYAVQGYQSLIGVLTGIDTNFTIVAIKILEQAETPGLGTEIETIPSTETIWSELRDLFSKNKKVRKKEIPAFQAQFQNKTIEQLECVRWNNPQKISAIAGATVTSDAVTKAVREPIAAFLKYKGVAK